MICEVFNGFLSVVNDAITLRAEQKNVVAISKPCVIRPTMERGRMKGGEIMEGLWEDSRQKERGEGAEKECE